MHMMITNIHQPMVITNIHQHHHNHNHHHQWQQEIEHYHSVSSILPELFQIGTFKFKILVNDTHCNFVKEQLVP